MPTSIYTNLFSLECDNEKAVDNMNRNIWWLFFVYKSEIWPSISYNSLGISLGLSKSVSNVKQLVDLIGDQKIKVNVGIKLEIFSFAF